MIEELDNKRKALHKKENKTVIERIEYTELNKVVKKKRRKRDRTKRKDLITKIIESGKGPREINKQGSRKKMTSMYKETGEVTSDRQGRNTHHLL